MSDKSSQGPILPHDVALHVFRLTGGEEWWIGETAEKVAEAHQKHCGLRPGDYGTNADDWEELRDEAPVTIFDTDDRSGSKTTKTCAEWARQNGPGFLCGTDF